MACALKLKEISKTLNGKRILRGINLEVPTGTCHVLLGASGSGKSTLLKIIMGLLTPDSGLLEVAGDQVGYVPQEGRLFPHLTARQNVTLVARLRGWDDDRIARRLAQLREITQFDDQLLDRYPKNLSGGQRQRVALLRATFLDPQLLLLDEPLGALDPITRVTVQDELKRGFRALNKSVLIVTHDLGEARFFGDRITLLDEGRVVQQGTYRDFVDAPAEELVTQFLQAQRQWEIA